MRKRKTIVATLVLTAAAVFVITAVVSRTKGKERFGGAFDPNAPTVTLAELVAKPDAYDGKTVIVRGQFAGACADGLDFYFKDKFDIIEANPPSPEVLTRLKKGTPVRLYGLVVAQPSGGREAEENSELKRGEVYVKIDAKAVEVL